MKKNLVRDKKGISSIFIALYMIIIGVILGVTLFSSLQISAASNIERLVIEQEKEQENIRLQFGSISLTEDKFIESLRVNNTGSITVKIKGIYIDSKFILDPSLFQNTHINPQETLEIDIYGNAPEPISYSDNKLSNITVTTERGTKFSDLLINLFSTPEIGGDDTVYGPLRLIFEDFYWKEFTENFGKDYLKTGWNEGWKVPDKTYLIWRIVIQNVGNHVINLQNGNETSLTLISNEGGNRWTYFVDSGCSKMIIEPKEYANIYFAWGLPNPDSRTQSKATSTLSTNDLRAFITFLVFEGQYGQTPIGETIPFEAVLVYEK